MFANILFLYLRMFFHYIKINEYVEQISANVSWTKCNLYEHNNEINMAHIELHPWQSYFTVIPQIMLIRIQYKLGYHDNELPWD